MTNRIKEQYYIYEFCISEDEVFRSNFSGLFSLGQSDKTVIKPYNYYRKSADPDGYYLMKREILSPKGEDLVEIEQDIVAFLPTKSIGYFLLVDRKDLSDDEKLILSTSLSGQTTTPNVPTL